MTKFKIPALPQSTQKTIRFPNYLIDKIEELIKGKDCTFSAFVIEAVRVVVEDLEDQKYK